MRIASMFRKVIDISYLIFFFFAVLTLQGQDLKYRDVQYDPVLKEMKDANKANQDSLDQMTDHIRDEQEIKSELEKDERLILAIDWSNIKKPNSPDDFTQVWHFPPTRQYLTGTCWSFSTTSFLESEINRQYGKQIRLSEMFTVYHEYLLKADQYIDRRGDMFFGQGSEANAVTRIWKIFGAVPRAIYPGVKSYDGQFDHSTMFTEIKNYLKWIKNQDYWDEELVKNSISVIMDRYLGTVPSHFIYDGVEYTPPEFLEEVLWLEVDDYVVLLSTLKHPFYTFCEFEVPDNWWRSADYYNVPLDQFYKIIQTAIKSGYSVLLGGDVSEPGIEGMEDAAIIPEFDIPRELINQASRELRMYNESTADDHGIHVVGYDKIGKDNWYLIKDSGSGGHKGQFPGYYFYREDYIKLKMCTVMVHKDIVQKVIKEFR